MIFNPLSFDAAAFLWLCGLSLVASLGLSWFAANRLRPTGKGQPVDHPDSLALLAGGTDRLTETVIARLLADETFTAAGPGFDRLAAAGVVPPDSVVLAGSPLEPLYRLRCGINGGGFDASSGASGCGGGGCGGCGG